MMKNYLLPAGAGLQLVPFFAQTMPQLQIANERATRRVECA
jgi:hypothetical protein